MAGDAEMFKLLDRAAVSYQLVLTKSDCIGPPELAARLGSLQTLLARRPAAYPEVAVTSARTGIGIAQLRAAIVRLLRERDQAPPGADLKH
jgi:GTP-binding protein